MWLGWIGTCHFGTIPQCSVVGISISKEQVKYANEHYGRSTQRKFIVCDYRDVLAQPPPNTNGPSALGCFSMSESAITMVSSSIVRTG
jgi:hypothetical protein